MQIRALLLASAMGTLLAAAPAMAQNNYYPNYYHTNPTPEERVQTNNLNTGAAAIAHTDADVNDANNADYSRRRADYDANRATYEAERAAYERARSLYNMDRYAYAHRWDAFYGYSRFRDVALMDNDRIVGMRVSSRGGVYLGRVRDVDTNRFGRITRVSVGISRYRVAWIDADDLRFDPAGGQLVTFLSSSQVNDMARMRYPRF